MVGAGELRTPFDILLSLHLRFADFQKNNQHADSFTILCRKCGVGVQIASTRLAPG